MVKVRSCEGSTESVLVRACNISYFSLYRFASTWDKILIMVGLTATFLAGITLPYAITLVANIFQSMIDYTKIAKKPNTSDKDFLKTMHHFGVHYTLIGLVLFVGGYLGNALLNITAIHQILKIREAYLRAALTQDFAYFDVHHTGDFASKMAEDVIKLEEGIGDKVSTLAYNTSLGVSSATMALMKGWKLALLCLIATPLTSLLVGLTGMMAKKWYKKQSEIKGLAGAVAEEAIASIKTVYAFNGQQKEIDRYKKYLAQVTSITIKKELFTGLSMGCLYFCVFASYALSFYFGIYLVVNEPQNYNADVMFSVFFGIMTAMGSFGMIGTLMTPFGQACGAGAEIFRLIDNVPKINPLLDKGLKAQVMEGSIELRNVYFQYPSRSGVPVLKDINLSIHRGMSVALVGDSGSGKSTIIHLLSRYYDVVEGSVTIDGHDVRELSVRWLRAQIGLVGQEPVLFNCSVRENIRYGREDASDEDIEAAARQANAHNFIVKLPAGYDTIVGQRGEFFSGGQKQRIAIARALIRNPSILLLDEATSALDIAAEAQVKFALDKASEGRTTVIVAHRLSTIRNATVIYVLKEGEVVESGSHEELLKMKGYYYNMLLIQEPPELHHINVEKIPTQEAKMYEYENTKSIVYQKSEGEKSIVPSLSFRQVLTLNAPEWKYIVLGSVCATINGFSMPVFIVIFGNLFGSMSNINTSQLMSKVESISMMCLAVGVILGISNFIETTSFGVAGTRLTERLRLRMFKHIMQQHVAFFEESANCTGALCARLSADAAQVQGATGQRVGIVLQSIGSVGLALVLGVLYEWRVGIIILAFVPFIALVVYKQGKATDKESSGSFRAVENSTKIAMEAVSNVRTVASLGLEQKVLSQYMAELRPALRPCIYNAHWRGLLNGLSRSMFNFINAAALTYGGHLIVSERVAPENILVTTQALQMGSTQAQNAFSFAPDFRKGMNAASRIVHFLESRAKIVDPDEPAFKNFTSKGEASLEHVEFSYPTRPTVQILLDLTIEIPRGRTVAVVGQSGCGKSTIIQLLQRYYDPDAGVVCLDKKPLPLLRINDVRSSFGLVSQEPTLFDRSIRENIAYGDNSRLPTDEEIYEVARQANIHNFVVSLPQGYETDIGSKGVQLSGGQKQRVAIARALLRRPRILLLDEATSALDTENEQVVQSALEAAKEGRTCVMIAHRLSTVRDADIICVLSGGHVAESGNHHHLMQLRGHYYNLYTKQQ